MDILISWRSTDFITPKSDAARAYRDAVLELAECYEFARPLVNSGRLSRPAILRDSPLNTPDDEPWAAGLPPGSPAADAPVRCEGADDWLLHHLQNFSLLMFGAPGDFPAVAPDINPVFVTPTPETGALHDHTGLAATRYDARPGTVVLLRPDQHVAARWRRLDAGAIARARARALG